MLYNEKHVIYVNRCVVLLVISSFFISCQDGYTALTLAAHRDHDAVVAILLQNNANTEAVDRVRESDCMHTNSFVSIYDNLHLYDHL